MNISPTIARRFAFTTIALLALWPVSPLRGDENETLQRATDTALSKLAQELGRNPSDEVKNVAVIPLRGDVDGYITERVRDAVTHTAYSLFTPHSDENWEKLLAEIKWGVLREDIMNPETVQKFGRIEGVDAIMYGIVWDRAINLWSVRAHVKTSLILAEVETGREIWRSGPLEGEAFMHWSDALMQFWRYPVLLIIVLAVLFMAMVCLHKVKKAYKQV